MNRSDNNTELQKQFRIHYIFYFIKLVSTCSKRVWRRYDCVPSYQESKDSHLKADETRQLDQLKRFEFLRVANIGVTERRRIYKRCRDAPTDKNGNIQWHISAQTISSLSVG